jgi:hypothetical protein
MADGRRNKRLKLKRGLSRQIWYDILPTTLLGHQSLREDEASASEANEEKKVNTNINFCKINDKSCCVKIEFVYNLLHICRYLFHSN